MLEHYGTLVANTIGALSVAEIMWRRPVQGTIAGNLSEDAVSIDAKVGTPDERATVAREVAGGIRDAEPKRVLVRQKSIDDLEKRIRELEGELAKKGR